MSVKFVGRIFTNITHHPLILVFIPILVDENVHISQRLEEDEKVWKGNSKLNHGSNEINYQMEITGGRKFEVGNFLYAEDVVRFIKAQRLRRLLHVKWRPPADIILRFLDWKLLKGRLKGTPRGRWKRQVCEDMRKMKIGNWRKLMSPREM